MPRKSFQQIFTVESQMQIHEQAYKLVLPREAENQVALRGLVEVRLQMHDIK